MYAIRSYYAFEAQGIARLIDVVLHAFPYFMLYTSGFALLLAFAGVTLLQRKEWGRRLAIGLMGWMILVGIGGAVLGTLFLVEVMSGGETFTIYAFVAGGFVGLISSLAWVGLYTYRITSYNVCYTKLLRLHRYHTEFD